MISNPFDVKDKVVVITGSSKGIGLALAKGFIEHGSLVSGISRSDSPLIGNDKYTHYNYDLNDRNSLTNLVDKILESNKKFVY